MVMERLNQMMQDKKEQEERYKARGDAESIND